MRRCGTHSIWTATRCLSSQEIAQADETLRKADISRDDTVSLTELEKAGHDRATYQRMRSYPLSIVFDEQTDWRRVRSALQKAYERVSDTIAADLPLKERIVSGDRSLSDADLVNLLALPPDLVCRVGFAKEGCEGVACWAPLANREWTVGSLRHRPPTR